jgi:hypothetical protein
MEENFYLPITHEEEDRPQCCGETMRQHFTKVPTIHWKDYDLPNGGFRPTSVPNAPVITSLKQNREFMKEHDLIDANEVFTPPTQEEQMETHREVMESIDKISLSDDEARKHDIV